MAGEPQPPPEVHEPPLPPLAWDGYFWSGYDTLPSWAGFQAREGAYTSRTGDAPSAGRVRVSVTSVRDDTTPPASPAPEQVAAYRYLKDHEATVTGAVVGAIFRAYPEMRDQFGADDDGDLAELMPPIVAADGLRGLVGLGTVHVLDVAKDGHAYIGFELGCTWDEEHGLGVMTHQGQVLEVGGADTSFLEWLAERHGGKTIGNAR